MEIIINTRFFNYRSSEFVALVAVSCTLFLFIHTKSLTSRLREMEIKLQPSEMSASGLSGNSISQGIYIYSKKNLIIDANLFDFSIYKVNEHV